MSKFEELAYKNIENRILKFADEHIVEFIDSTSKKTTKDDYLYTVLGRYRNRDGDLTNNYLLWETLNCYCGRCAGRTNEYVTVFETEISNPINHNTEKENLFRIHVEYDKTDRKTAWQLNLWRLDNPNGSISGHELDLEHVLPILRKFTDPIKDKLEEKI